MTYSDKENGGGFEQDVIPELTKMAEENEDFSGSEDKLNGAYSLPYTKSSKVEVNERIIS